jgi:hypothetical protein
MLEGQSLSHFDSVDNFRLAHADVASGATRIHRRGELIDLTAGPRIRADPKPLK